MQDLEELNLAELKTLAKENNIKNIQFYIKFYNKNQEARLQKEILKQ